MRFGSAIIAAGSQATKPPFIPDDPRIVDSTGALELKSVPKKMLVIGGGIIGLEMATVYSALGSRLDVVEMLDGLMLGADRDLVRVWGKLNSKRFDHVMLKTKTVKVEALKEGIKVWFESADAPNQMTGRRASSRDSGSVPLASVPSAKASRRRPRRKFTIWYWSPPGARPMARRSAPTTPASR